MDKGRSLGSRLRAAASLASAVEYLHSQGIVFHDLKPNNVGFNNQGNLKLLDFGLARFMPRHSDAYEDVFNMGGAGNLRYSTPEIFFDQPYNLKADVYSFSVMLWELVCLQKQFAKYKRRKEFEKTLLRVDKALVIDQRWPLPIHDIIVRSFSIDLFKRPTTMSEVLKALNECDSKGVDVEDCDFESTSTPSCGLLPFLCRWSMPGNAIDAGSMVAGSFVKVFTGKHQSPAKKPFATDAHRINHATPRSSNLPPTVPSTILASVYPSHRSNHYSF